jgi:hypothetical protein
MESVKQHQLKKCEEESVGQWVDVYKDVLKKIRARKKHTVPLQMKPDADRPTSIR